MATNESIFKQQQRRAGRFVGKNASAVTRGLVADLEAALQEGAAIERAFSEVVAPRRAAFFAAQERLAPAGRPCWFRLMGRRCNYRTVGHNSCLPPVTDHASLWKNAAGQFFLVSQPYSLSADHLREMFAFAEANGLEFSIDAAHSWHFPGWTVLVLWSKKEE